MKMLSPHSGRNMRRRESTHRRRALRLPGADAMGLIKLLGGEKHGQAEDTGIRRLGFGLSLSHSGVSKALNVQVVLVAQVSAKDRAGVRVCGADVVLERVDVERALCRAGVGVHVPADCRPYNLVRRQVQYQHDGRIAEALDRHSIGDGASHTWKGAEYCRSATGVVSHGRVRKEALWQVDGVCSVHHI
jgi:hypothetical protein